MKVDIWSDIRCPFCYIGKHNFEMALKQFEHNENVEVEWHSFQLDPTLETQPDIDTVDYFIKTKGVSRDQAQQMLSGAKRMAESIGLNLDLENSMVANSFKAHQLLQYSKTKGKANQTKEELFKVHFTEGKNIDDIEVLLKVAGASGLEPEETKTVLVNEEFSNLVKQDEITAKRIGVQGVPFFVFNNKYAVSGAQPPETFVQVLEKSWEEKDSE